ncbi:hypothetical protein ACWCQW_51425 [Streptomyces mirabilis]
MNAAGATGPGGRLPVHRRLLFRMLASSLLIVVCAIAVTAWLAVRTTTDAVRDQQGQVLADDTMIYRTLMSYAASHHDWRDAAPVVRVLARRTGRHITMTPQDTRRPVASGPLRPSLTPAKAFATVDALHTDPFLSPQTRGSGIDPAALGPYALRAADRRRLDRAANAVAKCLTGASVPFERSASPSGRPVIALLHDVTLQEQMQGADQQQYRAKRADDCGLLELDTPTADEDHALTALNDLVNACLRRQKQPTVNSGWTSCPAPLRRALSRTPRRTASTPAAANSSRPTSPPRRCSTSATPPARLPRPSTSRRQTPCGRSSSPRWSCCSPRSSPS